MDEFQSTVLLTLPCVLLVLVILGRLALRIREVTFAYDEVSTSKTYPSTTNGHLATSSNDDALETDPLLLHEPAEKVGLHTLYPPSENKLLRFKLLLYTKIAIAFCLGAIFLSLGAPTAYAESSGARYVIAAIGMLLASWMSYETHQTRWTVDLALQSAYLLQAAVLTQNASLEWARLATSTKRHPDSTELTLLLVAIALSLAAMVLEGAPRITSERMSKDSLSLEGAVNLFSYSTFFFLRPLFTKAYRMYKAKEAPDVDILWPLPNDLRSARLTLRFEAEWEKERAARKQIGKDPRFLIVLLKIHIVPLLLPISLIFIHALSQFASPALLNSFIAWIALARSDPASYPTIGGLYYAFAFLIVRVTVSCLQAVISYSMGRELIAMVASLDGAIYRKSLRLSPEEKRKTTVGNVVSHITVDTSTLASGWFFQMFISIVPSLGLGTYFLYQQLKWASFVGLGWVILVVASLQGFSSQAMAEAFGNRMTQLTQRTELVNEALSAIKIVKFGAWEQPLLKRIRDVRDKELSYIRSMGFIMPRLIFPSQFASTGAIVIMLIVYTTWIGAPDAQKVFVSITLFGILYLPIEQFGQGLGWFLRAWKSAGRISTFLNSEEIDPYWVKVNPKSAVAVKVENGTFGWKALPTATDGEELSSAGFTLSVPELTVKKGELLAVVGRVGCGKSTLVQSLLGRTHLWSTNGKITLSEERIAYCPQTAFVLAGTVRDNILGFDLPLNGEIMQEVIDACALREDITAFPGGLDCELGEKGINLSGGQRSRIALARACYSALCGQTSILLLDSVLEAVDANTDSHIWNQVLGSNGILKSCTRILITHGVRHLYDCDRICYMENGKIEQIGSHSELLSLDGPYAKLISEFAKEQEHKEEEVKEEEAVTEKKESDGPKADGKHTKDDTLTSTRIAPKTYMSYLSYAGWGHVCITISVWLLSRVISQSTGFWLSHWIDSNDAGSGRYSVLYLGVYTTLSLLTVLLVPIGLGCISLLVALPASRKIYDRMLTSVFSAPLSWFHVTPTGQVSNRLTSDISSIDWGLNFGTWIAQITNIVTNFISSTIVTRGLLLLVVPIFLPIYWFIFIYYTATSRALRRLSAGRTLSPMISQVTETVEGSDVINAIKAQEYPANFFTKRDTNESAGILMDGAAGWLAVLMSFLGSGLVFIASILVVLLRMQISPSLAGLAIYLVLGVSGSFGVFISASAQLETDAVHVERCLEYVQDIPPEAPAELPADDSLDVAWPQNGHITFKNASARYRPELPLSLKDINFDIKPQTKLAIVGRTGSGKSSLTLTLFRLLELAEGVIEIDGHDISKIGLQRLRRSIAIIPQENQALAGNVRTNLDPFSQHGDDQLWTVLEAAQLKDLVSNLEGKLDAPVRVGGSNFSAGQLQQLGLARALLLKTNIVILDEATSSLDLKTDALIQKSIRTHFGNATVITIAHRLRTVLDCDEVVVMSDGQIAELGKPKELLQKQDGLFKTLAKEAGEDSWELREA